MKNLCLNNVEYKRLEDCCIILDNKRKPVTKTARKSGVYPYYGANGIQDYVSDYIFDGVFVLIGEDGSVVNENGNPVVNWAEGKIWVNNHAHIIQEKDGVLLRYIFYFIQTIKIKNLIYGNIPKLTGNNFKSLKISVPSLEIQQKIAEILSAQDKVIELKQKLIDRKKQQKKWLMQNLLTGKIRLKGFKGEWEKVKLEEIFSSINSGKSVKNEENGIYSIYGSTGEIGKANSYDYDENIIIVARVGANAGSLYKIYNKCKISDNALLIRINEKNSFLFIFYLLCQINLRNLVYGSGQPLITSGHIKKILTCIPLIEEQTAIVEILSVQDREIELLEKELEQEKLKKKFLMNLLLSGK